MNDDKSSILISQVKQYPYLYDKNHAYFKDVNKKFHAWKEIAKHCKMKVQDCRIRWKTLRDKYCRIKRKMLQSKGLNLTIKSTKNAEFMKQINFLENVIVHKWKSNKINESEEKQKGVISSDNVSSNTESLNSEYVSIQLLPTLPITQWSQAENENVHYIKIDSDASTYSQAKSTEWNHDSIDYKVYYTDKFEERNGGESKAILQKGLTDDNMLTQNNSNISGYAEPHVTLKLENDNDINGTDEFVLKMLWNIIKDKKLNVNNDNTDQLFVLSLIETLSKYPPNKKNLIKGEILLLLSKYDYREID